MLFKRIVAAVQIVALISAVVFVVMLFVNDPDDAAPVVDGEADGAALYRPNCATCHGDTGEGGIGPRLAGVVAEKYPDEEDQISVVESGPGSMPAFSDTLTDEEIRAIVQYTREDL